MNIDLTLRKSIKVLKSKGFDVSIHDRIWDRQTYGVMYRKAIILNGTQNVEVQMQTLVKLIINYLATQNKENFRIKLTDNPKYPRDYRLENRESDLIFQVFRLLNNW